MPDGAGTSREREDAEQALGHMNRRALERERRIGLKEQKESWVGLFRLFDRAQARERYPSLAKDHPRGEKSSICEPLSSWPIERAAAFP